MVCLKTGALKCARLEFSGCCVKPRRPGLAARDRSVAAQDGTLHETPEVIDKAELKNVRRIAQQCRTHQLSSTN